MSTTTPPAWRVAQDERYQRNLQLAVQSSWFAYVFSGAWWLCALIGWATGALIEAVARVGCNPSAIWNHLLHTGILTWGLGFLLSFRLLFRSIDRAGKRKVACTLGMLPPSSRA